MSYIGGHLEEQFVNYIGRHGHKQGIDDILAGKGDPNRLPICDTSIEYINQLKFPRTYHGNVIDPEVPAKEYRDAYRKKRESTMSSPSGIHVVITCQPLMTIN